MADEQHQDDPTVNMSIDQKITPNIPTQPDSFDIAQPVVPGHDMVINHLDGSQELGTGNETLAVTAAEAESGTHVPLSDVQGKVEAETQHRSVSDPEVNGTDQDALTAEKTAQAAPAEPEVPEEEPTPEPEQEADKEANADPKATAPSEPTSEDVDGV